MSFAAQFLDQTVRVVSALDADDIDATAVGLGQVRDRGGRLFILGVGGSAGHASHAVNDFRKICGFEAYAPTDNVCELTARVNDEGWDRRSALAGYIPTQRTDAVWCSRSAAAMSVGDVSPIS